MKINRKTAIKWINRYNNEKSIKREAGSGKLNISKSTIHRRLHENEQYVGCGLKRATYCYLISTTVLSRPAAA